MSVDRHLRDSRENRLSNARSATNVGVSQTTSDYIISMCTQYYKYILPVFLYFACAIDDRALSSDRTIRVKTAAVHAILNIQYNLHTGGICVACTHYTLGSLT